LADDGALVLVGIFDDVNHVAAARRRVLLKANPKCAGSGLEGAMGCRGDRDGCPLATEPCLLFSGRLRTSKASSSYAPLAGCNRDCLAVDCDGRAQGTLRSWHGQCRFYKRGAYIPVVAPRLNSAPAPASCGTVCHSME